MSFKHIADFVPDYQGLPTLDEMYSHTSILAAQKNPLITIRPLGVSREGEPIELISVGCGKHQALLVGTPHPNEPIGCLTIEFLLDHLIADQQLRQELDYTWHFIKSIEPDGLRINEGWLKTPHDFNTYLKHFFRPALDEQADYTFPLNIPNYSFANSSPENIVWQEAIRIVKPDLLVSLHNSEHGGVFYVLTEEIEELSAQLVKQPEIYGMPLDVVGELFAETKQLHPGVFLAPNIENLVSAPVEARVYNAGNSSFGFTKKMGTFGLVVETPYWKEVNSLASEEMMSLEGVMAPLTSTAEEVISLITTLIPRLSLLAKGREIRFVRAINEMQLQIQQTTQINLTQFQMQLPVAVCQAHQRSMRMMYLRPISMLRQLAFMVESRCGESDTFPKAAEEMARSFLDKSISDPVLSLGMEPVSLKTSVSIQVDAILTTALLLQQKALGSLN